MQNDTTPLGISDIIAGAIIFLLLAWLAVSLAGPEGVGFLKNLLTPERAFELLCSGGLFLLVWLVIGEMVAKPYLENHFLREEKTLGLQEKNAALKKEIEKLKLEIVSELRTARLEGIKKRDIIIADSRKKAQEMTELGKQEAGKDWAKVAKELEGVRAQVFDSLDGEVSGLASAMYSKIVSSSGKVLHSVIAVFLPLGALFAAGLLTAVLFTPGLCYAASGGHTDAGIETLLYPALNFSIYMVLVFWVARKFVRPVLRNFRAEVESFAVRVQNEYVTLERELEQLRFRLEHISEEKSELVQELEKSARDISGEIALAANQKVENMRRDVLLRSESEKQKVYQAAKQELVAKVIHSVRDMLSKNYSEDQDKLLIRSVLSGSETQV